MDKTEAALRKTEMVANVAAILTAAYIAKRNRPPDGEAEVVKAYKNMVKELTK